MTITTSKITVEFNQFVDNTLYGDNTLYTTLQPLGIRLMLLTDATGISLTGTNDKQNFFIKELTDSAYSRQTYTPSTSSYDGTNRRVTRTTTPIGVSPGTSLTYQAIALVYGGRSGKKPSVVTPNVSPDTFTLSSHGLSNGEEVIIYSVGGSRPTGISNVIYYAKSIDTNTFEIYSDVGLTTKVTFTDAGSGTIYVNYCRGIVMGFAIHDVQQTILSTQTSTINSNIGFTNTNYAVGV